MINTATLLQYANLTNVKTETTFPQSTLKRYIKTGEGRGCLDYYTSDKLIVGIEHPKKNAWFWFDTFINTDAELNDVNNKMLMFTERFNVGSGKSIKAFNTGYNFEMKIENAINK